MKMKQQMGKGKDGGQQRGNAQDDGKLTSGSEVPRPGLGDGGLDSRGRSLSEGESDRHRCWAEGGMGAHPRYMEIQPSTEKGLYNSQGEQAKAPEGKRL